MWGYGMLKRKVYVKKFFVDGDNGEKCGKNEVDELFCEWIRSVDVIWNKSDWDIWYEFVRLNQINLKITEKIRGSIKAFLLGYLKTQSFNQIFQ